MRTVKIIKIEKLEDSPHPNNIEVNHTATGMLVAEPEVGKAVYIDRGNRYFRTSVVTEVIDENTFKTLNSIYRLENE